MVNMSIFLFFPIIHLLHFHTLNLLTEPHSHIPRRTRPFSENTHEHILRLIKHHNWTMATIPEHTDTMDISTRSDKSTPISLLQTILKPFRPHLIKPKKEFPAGSPYLDVHKTAKKRCNVTERQVQGIWLYDMKPKLPASSAKEGLSVKRRNIFYFAGGGWQMPPSPEHWKLCAELCHRCLLYTSPSPRDS